VFETLSDIDFSSPFNASGTPNRLIIPNFDSNQVLTSYFLTKREIVQNGISKIFSISIYPENVVPFYEVYLPENNILGIESVILLDNANNTTSPTNSQFNDISLKWFEVDSLAENKVFVEDTNKISTNPSLRAGKYITIDQKFIKEYTDRGFVKLIFGSGTQDITSLYDFGVEPSLINQIGDMINNTSLGKTLSPNTTLFVKYRVGGGSDTNLGQGVITSKNQITMLVNGTDTSKNAAVRNSLTVNNPIPALGGKDEPTIEEIRNLIRYNFSAQNRAVTIKDYQSRIGLMDGRFGVPFRSGVVEEQNKIKVYVMSLNADNKLDNSSNSTLKENITDYLSDYKMLNDYIEVSDGNVINIGVNVDLLADKNTNKSEIINERRKQASYPYHTKILRY
jgi:hypothetical protein